jgi:hypothetical protein
MAERERPNLDRVRDAMREHDDRSGEPAEEEPPREDDEQGGEPGGDDEEA